MDLLFDLDGTLTDSSPGIVRCINHALAVLGREPVAEASLRSMIGLPLMSIFGATMECDDERVLDAAIEAYRERFNDTGVFENSLYPGVREMLDEVCRAGHTLQLVTVKPRSAAALVLEHFGIAGCFAAVHGPELDQRTCDKADLVHAALRLVNGDVREAVMIGDRAEDVRAARRHDVRAIAAGWGYGHPEELLAAGPEYLAPTVADLVAWVRAAG